MVFAALTLHATAIGINMHWVREKWTIWCTLREGDEGKRVRETETAGRGGLARDLKGKERNTLEKRGDGETKRRRREGRKWLEARFKRHGGRALPGTKIDSKVEKVVSGWKRHSAGRENRLEWTGRDTEKEEDSRHQGGYTQERKKDIREEKSGR